MKPVAVRALALPAAVLLAALLVSACEQRSGLLAAQRSAAPSRPATSSSKPPPPPPTWQLAEAADTEPSSVLWDVDAVDATHAWAVGHDTYDPEKSDTTGVPIIQQWDGTTWTRTELPGVTWHGSLSHVAAGSATDVWAVGGWAGDGPADTVTKVLHYDGTTWSEVPLPDGVTPGTNTNDLAAAGGHAWIVGYRAAAPVILEWDGSAWQQREVPDECRQTGTSFGGMPTFCNVTGITAFAADDAWIAGNAAWPGFKGPLLFHWDGSAWAAVRVGIDNMETALSSVAGSPGDVWAVGDRTGSVAPVAVHGDGRTWKVIAGLPRALYTGVEVDRDGHPWVLQNSTAPAATLVTYGPKGWVDTAAPLPPDTVGITLRGITTVPGTPNMFAVGDVDLPGLPRLLQSVLLEYRS